MKKSKSKVLVSMLMLTLILGIVPVSAAEEIKIGSFRNIIAGADSSNSIAANLGTERKIGWQNVNGVWHYFQPNGQIKTGWLYDNGKWYYFDSTGSMMSDTMIDGYKLNSTGEWINF